MAASGPAHLVGTRFRRVPAPNWRPTITDSPPLAGRRALITGGALRLGRAIATGLADAGADLVLHYRSSRDAAEDLAASLTELGVRVDLVQADLSDPAAAGALLDRAWDSAGPIDMLVNSASRFPSGRLETLRFEELTGVLALNTWAPFVVTRRLAERIRGEVGHHDEPGSARRGAVVNMLDTRIIGEDLPHAAYHLSKRTLADLTRMTAIELAPEVRVNAVAPGYILPPPDQDRAYLERRAREVPLGRPGSPADIAGAVVYLMSAEYVTGQTIFVDGGQNLAPERATT